MEKALIGITGKAGSGKDTVGDCIIKHAFGQGVVLNRVSFAAPLKGMLAAMLDVPFDMLDGKTEESRRWREEPQADIGQSPREMMLSLGTEWGRDLIHRDLWVLLVASRFRLFPLAVITDVRFDNEAKWIKEEGGILIETVNSTNEFASRVTAEHRSEAGVDRQYIDITLRAAHGQLDLLRSNALHALRKIECPYFS